MDLKAAKPLVSCGVTQRVFFKPLFLIIRGEKCKVFLKISKVTTGKTINRFESKRLQIKQTLYEIGRKQRK